MTLRTALDLSDHYIIVSQEKMNGGPFWVEARPKRDNGMLYYVFGPFGTIGEAKEYSENLEVGVRAINEEGVTRFTYRTPHRKFTSAEWNA